MNQYILINNLRDLSKLDLIIISKAIVNTWNQNMNNILELFESKKNNYVKVIIDIIYQLNHNKSTQDLISMLYDITMSLNDNIKYFSDNPALVPVPVPVPIAVDITTLQNLPSFNNLNIHNYPNIIDVSHININWSLYDATCKLFTNYFNIDSAEKEFRKIRYIELLNENLSKNSINNSDIYTVNRALSAYIRVNNINNPVVNPVNIFLNIELKNKLIKLLGTKYSISSEESFVLINKNFINNIGILKLDNEINYPLFYDVINMFI